MFKLILTVTHVKCSLARKFKHPYVVLRDAVDGSAVGIGKLCNNSTLIHVKYLNGAI